MPADAPLIWHNSFSIHSCCTLGLPGSSCKRFASCKSANVSASFNRSEFITTSPYLLAMWCKLPHDKLTYPKINTRHVGEFCDSSEDAMNRASSSPRLETPKPL